jgi:hypothetical protein
MPAIQPVRLKNQAIRLAQEFTQPGAFVNGFSALMEEYADHTHRYGKAGEPAPLLTSFRVPPPVYRQVWLEILPFISTTPQSALELCDTLWELPYLEHRILAADILGALPVYFQEEVINRIQLWTRAGIEDRLVDILLEHGLARLSSQSAQAVISLIEIWLSSPDKIEKQLGLRLLHALAGDPTFTDLPVLFRLLSPYLRIAPPAIRPDIITALITLIHRSAPEVAFLLRQNLTAADNPDTAWLLRQVILEFPPDLQAGLRDAIRRK